MSLSFDFDQVTPRMLLDFKKQTGTALMSLVDDKGDLNMADLSEEQIAGFVWLALRMSGTPDATWDEALDTPFTSLSFEEDEADPTSADNGS